MRVDFYILWWVGACWCIFGLFRGSDCWPLVSGDCVGLI